MGDHTVLSAAEKAEAWCPCLALLLQLRAGGRPGAVALNVALGAARTWQRAVLGFADAVPDRIRFNALLRSLSAAWRQGLRALRCFEVGQAWSTASSPEGFEATMLRAHLQRGAGRMSGGHAAPWAEMSTS